MTTDPLEALLDFAESLAQDELRKKGEVTPCFVCEKHSGEGFIMEYETPSTAPERRAVALELGSKMRELGVARYCAIHEVWVTNQPEEGSDITPSEDQTRIDALWLEAHDTTNRTYRFFRIDRSGKEPKLADFDEMMAAGFDPGDAFDNLLIEPRSIH